VARCQVEEVPGRDGKPTGGDDDGERGGDERW